MNTEKRMSDRYLRLYSIKLKKTNQRDSDSDEDDRESKQFLFQDKFKVLFSFITEARLDIGKEIYETVEKLNPAKGKKVAETKYPTTIMGIINPDENLDAKVRQMKLQSFFIYVNVYNKVIVFERPMSILQPTSNLTKGLFEATFGKNDQAEKGIYKNKNESPTDQDALDFSNFPHEIPDSYK